MLAQKISVNVTLIFSRERYRAVMEAYLTGCERLLAATGSLVGPGSVASFFVSRVDTEIDRRLAAIGSPAAAALRGRAAIANARLAYRDYEEVFADLAAAGISLPEVTEALEREGVEKFTASSAELTDSVSAALPHRAGAVR